MICSEPELYHVFPVLVELRRGNSAVCADSGVPSGVADVGSSASAHPVLVVPVSVSLSIKDASSAVATAASSAHAEDCVKGTLVASDLHECCARLAPFFFLPNRQCSGQR